mmetsp:Transcript_29646/g.68055  ORF Transcript_29646/g.68055 Transcript_29646/m.68055 type:complete len:375 (-) Transcript_29646:134-1258(-)
MEMQSVAVAAKYSRRKAHELAGAMRMLSLMVQHPPIPATSPPARHKGWRLNKWEKAVELEHSRMRAISVKVARESRLGAGHIAEFRALLCLSSTSCELPLTVSTVRQFADWMHLRLFPKSKDLQKISLAVKLAIAPLPLPWKSVPIGFQNMENGDVIQRHPLHNCFCQLHPSLEDRASTLSELGMLCWWEFAPWATDVERATVLKAIEAGNEEIRLFDMCTGKRADSLRAAMPTLPFPRTDVMPRIQQEPSAKSLTEATLRALQASRYSNGQLCAASLDSRQVALSTRPRSLLELNTAAIYLGIQLRTHPELVWLASALFAAELPIGWHASKTTKAQGGNVFYFNPTLDCVQWEHPAHAHLRGIGQFLMGNKKA